MSLFTVITADVAVVTIQVPLTMIRLTVDHSVIRVFLSKCKF